MFVGPALFAEMFIGGNLICWRTSEHLSYWGCLCLRLLSNPGEVYIFVQHGQGFVSNIPSVTIVHFCEFYAYFATHHIPSEKIFFFIFNSCHFVQMPLTRPNPSV